MESHFEYDQQHSNELESTASLFAKAVRHHRYGELSKAEALYKRILARDSNHPGAMKNYGVLCFQFDDFHLAEEMFEKAYASTPFDEKLAVNLLICKTKLDKPGEVLPIINAILTNNPENKTAKDIQARLQDSEKKEVVEEEG